jgi:hypothetical protein
VIEVEAAHEEGGMPEMETEEEWSYRSFFSS